MMSEDLMKQADEALQRGDRRAARALLEKVLSADADNIEALHLLSTFDIDEGMAGLAQEKIARVLAIEPAHAPAIYNQGVCLMMRGDQAPALEAFRKAVQIDPRHSGALYNIGYILRAQGNVDEALKVFAALVRLNPGWLSARDAYCDTLLLQGQALQVLTICDEPIEQGKATATTFRLRGDALRQLGRRSEAEEEYKRSLQLDTANADTLHAFGSLLQEMGRFEDAVLVFERETLVAGVDPRFTDRFDQALAQIIRSNRSVCQWKNLSYYEEQALKRAAEGTGAVDPLLALTITDDPNLQRVSARKAWQHRSIQPTGTPKRAAASAKARTRIGYLFGSFVTQRLAAVAEHHDKQRFEVIGYNAAAPGTGDRITKAFETYRDVTSLTNEAIAAAIAADGIDILVDVMGFTAEPRLGVLAYKPSPIVAHLMGYHGTLGTKLVDYLIADEHTIRAGEEKLYDEKIIRLPGTCRPLDNTRKLPAMGQPRSGKDHVDFCAFAEPLLLGPQIFDAYMNILKQVPKSRLWLLDYGEIVRKHLLDQAKARGIDADRLEFVGGTSPEDISDRLQLSDVFLDAWPYTGHTFTSDALWLGVPAVTWAGRSFAARVGASLLNAAGMPDLVAQDAQSFQRLAAALGTDAARLATYRDRLLNNRASIPLFDTRRFTGNLERAFEWIADRQRKGQAPEAHDVPRLH